ncbi:MAG TPA: contractile injection system tape measure protein [Microthrixaceae bacterium]|nr:contractile injection system tape measure protein [Microthrixaceae bacterium]
MADPATITIRRQILDVELHGAESDGLALQHRLSAISTDVLSPALEAAFGGIDADGVYLSVDRLEIDLGNLRLDRLEPELVEALGREVADHFRHAAMVPAGAETPAGASNGTVLQRSVAETLDDALVVFLRTGRLPWFYRPPPGSSIESLVLEAWDSRDTGPPSLTTTRLRSALADPTARTRLFAQFSPRFVTALLDHLAPELAIDTEQVVRAVHTPEVSATARTAFTRLVWDLAFSAASTRRTVDARELVAGAWPAGGLSERDERALADAIEVRWPGAITRLERSGPVAEQPVSDRSGAERIPAALDEGDDGLVIDNAGLVLLHPFLVSFLEGLGVASEGELIDPNRALCLLHHLATGERTAPEHQLTLAKVLCGIPLDVPAESDVGLTDDDAAEATALLDAAIGHWEALRNTSVDTLRAEFLVRPGSLAVDAFDDWVLRVEPRGVDILLDQLPWGTSAVKLPWMRHLMKVEWR